ncbi:hypothetical protein [Geomicrobium sp. JCM 19039]|uniref:hypothetical protein n=1 Tax=Geomicrobium sp. JCM 19039 TaxID=1460636 RepID=UPI00045F469F|nr:hypothetical protein [Geomicrobium sp. JCM 19039]GAK14546.1 hypothetical protein JCM19039_4475 [Geomicrobium sp. JCM 19039]
MTWVHTISGVIAIFVIMAIMDWINFPTQGTNNFLGTLDDWGVNFLSMYNDNLYNIFGSLTLIISPVVLIMTLVTKAKK